MPQSISQRVSTFYIDWAYERQAAPEIMKTFSIAFIHRISSACRWTVLEMFCFWAPARLGNIVYINRDPVELYFVVSTYLFL